LIALGLAESRQQVDDIVRSVDSDGSGWIEFSEFLEILKKDRVESKSESKSAISQIFRELASKKQVNKKAPKNDSANMPFRLYVSYHRRRMLMDAIMSSDPQKKEKGEKIMKAYSMQILNQKEKKISSGILESYNFEEDLKTACLKQEDTEDFFKRITSKRKPSVQFIHRK